MTVQYVSECKYYIQGTQEDKRKVVHLRQNLARAYNRNNAQSITITLNEIFEIGVKQNWKDCFTGEPLEFTRGGNYGMKNNTGTGACNPYSCSIDRINSNLGYHKNNIQLVTSRTNMLKGNMTNTELIEFCKKVIKNLK